jgi:RimJ/RimL family protein N-acetyltransferase
VKLLNEPSFIENIGDRGVRSIKDAHRYMREGPMAMYEKYGFGLWHTALKDGTFIGMCGLLKRDHLPAPDVGYAFLPPFWGQGFAHEAAAATLHHCTRKFGLSRVLGVVSEGNAGSIRVLEKLGMTFDRMISMREGEPLARLYGVNLSGE